MIPPYFKIGFNSENVLEEIQTYKNSKKPNKAILLEGLDLVKNCQMATNLSQKELIPNIQTIRTYLKFSENIRDQNWLKNVRSTIEELLKDKQILPYNSRSLEIFFQKLSSESLSLSREYNQKLPTMA